MLEKITYEEVVWYFDNYLDDDEYIRNLRFTVTHEELFNYRLSMIIYKYFEELYLESEKRFEELYETMTKTLENLKKLKDE